MKIILLKEIRGVGHPHEVKVVSDGYATNFLLPQKLAEMATSEKVKVLVAQKEAREAQVHKEEETLDAKILSLKGKTVSIQARATEGKGLFKTLSSSDITKALLSEYSLEVPEKLVYFLEPIKTLGEHVVELKSKNKKVEIGILVTPIL